MSDITSNLVGHWALNQLSGNSAPNTGSDGNAHTFVNTPTWYHTAGIGGLAMWTGDEIFVVASAPTLPVTISAWILGRSLVDLQNVFESDSVYAQFDEDSGGLYLGNAENLSEEWGTTLSTGANLHHVVLRDDGTTCRAYFDGVFVAEIDSAEGMDGPYNTNSVSVLSNSARAYVDDLRVYNRTLSDGSVTIGQTATGDIAALFATGPSAAPTPSPLHPRLRPRLISTDPFVNTTQATWSDYPQTLL